ncbi:MAG: hypothetical protein IPK81_09925 [Rhodospirillales bacterium]|nr:MAG: hypothetical protein IPK81_09925 [Rhodospirillales bacterium]
MIDFQAAPLWMIFALSVVLVGGANEAGRYVRRRFQVDGDDNTATLEGSVLGMLGLMIGFSFAISVSNFDARRDALLDEANAIGTTGLRARLLPAPHNREVLDLLREYTKLRVDVAASTRSMAALDKLIDRSNTIHEALWQQAKAVAAKDPGMVPTGLFIQSLNDMIDSHLKRLTAARVRLPGMVLFTLYGIAAVAAGLVGYTTGLTARRAILPTYVVSAVAVAVILLVADLDRPDAGFTRVDQQPMIETAKGLAGYKD